MSIGSFNITRHSRQSLEAYVVGDGAGISNTVSKFGSRSLKLWNGTGSSSTYVAVTPSYSLTDVVSTNVNNGFPNFTLEFWIYMVQAPTTTVNFFERLLFSTEFRFTMQANLIPQLRYRYYNPYPTTLTERTMTAVEYATLNTWKHLAFTKSGQTISFFMNGSRYATSTETAGVAESGDTNSGWSLGTGASQGMQCYIDEFRISNTVRYSGSTYTVPTAPFTNDQNTLGLLHFEDAVGSKIFKDDLG